MKDTASQAATRRWAGSGMMASMRILHFADLHIGVENYGRPDPETGLSTRLNDFLAAYDAIVDYALDTSVDLVLFCGDAYKSRDPSQTHQREFAKRIAMLSSHGVPVFLLVGNHDLPHVLGRATALEIFQTLDVANVHIGNALKTYRIETASGPVQVVGRALGDSQLPARQGGDPEAHPRRGEHGGAGGGSPA